MQKSSSCHGVIIKDESIRASKGVSFHWPHDCLGVHRIPTNCNYIGPVMWKAFLCCYVIMRNGRLPLSFHPLFSCDLYSSVNWVAFGLTHWGWDEIDNISQTTFWNVFPSMKIVWISIKMSLKFVPKGSINNISVLVQIMAWCRSGNKTLSEPMMVRLPTHICVTRPQLTKHWLDVLFDDGIASNYLDQCCRRLLWYTRAKLCERQGVPFHRQFHYLFNSLFGLITKKAPRHRFTVPLWGGLTCDWWIPTTKGQ